MADTVLELQSVYKKFRRGELYNSLRDFIPGLTRRIIDGKRAPELDKREFWALRDVSFRVERGEAFGIIGGNGAGKSTMLKLLTGIMRPTKGSVRVAGRMSALLEVSAGFHQDLTGRENIYLNGAILGMTREELRRRFDAIVDFSGLEKFIDTPVKRYSSGMFARLGFSVAAHVDPEVLIVDEVLSVGDYVFQQKCIARMRAVIRSGTTVLFVSHNLLAVADLCPRSMLLDHGKLVAIGPTGQVIRQYLDASSDRRKTLADSPVYISAVRIRDETGESIVFETGQRVWIDVEVMARRPSQKLAVVLDILGESQREVFNTSSERLGAGNFSLDAEEKFTCTFELQLNMVPGAFHASVFVHRYDIQKTYDEWLSAGRIFVRSNIDVRGIVNCFPRIIHQGVTMSAPPHPA